jgi:hypothetical protein
MKTKRSVIIAMAYYHRMKRSPKVVEKMDFGLETKGIMQGGVYIIPLYIS